MRLEDVFYTTKRKKYREKRYNFFELLVSFMSQCDMKKGTSFVQKKGFFSFVYKSFFQIPETKPFATLTFDLNKNSFFPSFSFFVYSSSLKEKGKKRHLCTL
jgi:hypothetical protein